MNRIFFILAVSLTIALNSISVSADESALTLNDLVTRLTQNHPAIKARGAETLSSKERVPQAGALDDPMVGVEFMNVPASNPSLRREDMTSFAISAQQNIPFPGKKRLDKKIARLEADQMSLEEKEVMNQQIAMLKEKFYMAGYAKMATAILSQSIGRLQALSRSMEAGYAGGNSSFDEVLRTKSESSRLESEKVEMVTMAERLTSQIALMIGWSSPEPLQLAPISVDIRALAHSAHQLTQVATTNRPMISSSNASVNQSEIKVKRAKRDYLPNFTVGASYMIRQSPMTGLPDRTNMFSTSLMMNVPLWGLRKQAPHVREMKAQKLSAQLAAENVILETRLDIEQLVTELKQLGRQIQIYQRSLLPQARAATTASLRSLTANQNSFATVIGNEIMANDSEMMLAKMQFDYAAKLSILEWLTGWSVDQLTNNP